MSFHPIKQKIIHIYHRLPLPAWVAIAIALQAIIFYGLLFGLPKQVTFSYAGDTCVRHFTIGPKMLKQSGESNYIIQTKDAVKLGDTELFSSSICFTPISTPTAGNHIVKASPFGGWLAVKQFNIEVAEAPVANVADFINKTVPTTRNLKISLSATDNVFEYTLTTDNKSTKCDTKDASLHCDIPALNLEQGAKYEVALERHFKDERVATLATGTVTTLLPLKQTDASISEAQVVYNKPTQLVFTYDKDLAKGEVNLKKQIGEAWEVVPITVTTKDKTLIVGINSELPRKSQFELTVQHAEAKDGSALDGPAVTHFSTSGGPKVTGVNIGSSGVNQSGTIIITLDQEVANIDKLAGLVLAEGMAVQVTKSGNTLRLKYANAPFCSPFTLSIKQGLESTHGIVSDENWLFKSRTICHTIRTIGYSTQGRAINAYTYGSGSKTILYVGSLHGNEHSSRLLMNAWMNELEANPGNIPAGTRIIVIPSANPDGTARNSRYNANNVDLNRNFNVSDWKSDIQTVSAQPMPGGGGSVPESEVETRVLVNFSREVAPHLTMSYHAAAAYAIGNTCGNSGSLAAKYASLTGYRNMTGVSGAFSYEITGTYDDWLCEKQGRTSVLIELATSSNAEFNRNKAALWEMARS